MGQANGAELIRDTIDADQFLEQQLSQHEIVHLAFAKCVVPSTKGGKQDGRGLTPEEKACVNEYASLYAGQLQKGYLQFRTLFEQQQLRTMEKARQEHMERMAREDLHR